MDCIRSKKNIGSSRSRTERLHEASILFIIWIYVSTRVLWNVMHFRHGHSTEIVLVPGCYQSMSNGISRFHDRCYILLAQRIMVVIPARRIENRSLKSSFLSSLVRYHCITSKSKYDRYRVKHFIIRTIKVIVNFWNTRTCKFFCKFFKF